MKKLLLLLFSILITFSSSAEWVYIDKNQESDTKVYVRTDTIEVKDGIIYWWSLINYTEPQQEGMLSNAMLRGGQCNNNRFVELKFQWFKGSMSTGEIGGTFEPEQQWTNPKAGTIEEKVFNYVCDYVESLRAEAEEKPKSYSESINAQVAKNAIRCLALSYLQTTIPENEKFSQGDQIFSKVYDIHYEEYSGENLTIGDINDAREQAVREVAFDFSNDSYGDYVLAKEFRHCAYWVYDIVIYLSNIEKDFHLLPIQTEIPPGESALREKQIFLLIPTKSSTTNFENDIALWDQQLFQGFKFWMDLGAPLSF